MSDTDGGSGNGDGGDDDGDGGDGARNGGDDSALSAAEKGVIAVSVTLTVVLFTFAVWQAVVPPGATAPEVQVVDERITDDGDVAFTVAVRNPTDVGMVSVTVEANCTSPPTEMTFEHVPANSRRVGTIVCPAGTTDPGLSISSWSER